MTDPMDPVLVHVTNAHEIAPPKPAEEHGIAADVRTFTLKTGQTGDPVDSAITRILDRDPMRAQALITVASGTVYLCHSRAQAQAAAADASAVGGAQDGYLLAAGQYLPPLRTTDPLWAAVPSDKAAAGAQVCVLAERRRT